MTNEEAVKALEKAVREYCWLIFSAKNSDMEALKSNIAECRREVLARMARADETPASALAFHVNRCNDCGNPMPHEAPSGLCGPCESLIRDRVMRTGRQMMGQGFSDDY